VAAFATLGYYYPGGALRAAGLESIYAFGCRALMLAGVALTAANLTKTRDRAEAKLLSAIEEINRQILSKADVELVMNSILNTAMSIADSDVSAIVLVEGNEAFSAAIPTGKNRTPTSKRDISEAERFVRQNCQRVLASGQPLTLPEQRISAVAYAVRRSQLAVEHWSAKLIPLESDGTLFGVLGVFSRSGVHYYTKDEERRLFSMAGLIAMAKNNAKLYQDLDSREREGQGRLQMLYEIGEQLKSDQELGQLFKKVVKLVSTRLQSEEAALFIPEDTGQRLKKVAVSGPDDETTRRLAEIEVAYESEESLTGRVFRDKRADSTNQISRYEAYADEYSKRLPSGIALHYMGAPLIIGDEVLGVIRVLNRKAPCYSLPDGNFKLAAEGFGKEDLGLLSMIATQVASAIRNAKFIERNRYFKNLVYESPDPIIVLDKAGKIINFNEECEKIWGWSEDEVRGHGAAEYYDTPQHAREIGAALWSVKGHTIRDYPARIRAKNGEVIPIRLSASLFVDKEGEAAGSIGVFKDQRPILRAEEERLRSEKLAALGRLAHTVGHDIKHDLGTVLNYAEVLDQTASDPDAKQVFTAIRDATHQALEKLQNMLMAAKPGRPELEIVSLQSILRALEEGFQSRMAAMNIEFCVRGSAEGLLLRADPDQLRQVFANLLGNSIDAIQLARHPGQKGPGRIELSLATQGDTAILSWSDNGCGMTEEARARAFTAFFTTKTTGSGLGLFITKTIIESHGGQIRVDPADGGGVCFLMRLPLYQASPISIQKEARV